MYVFLSFLSLVALVSFILKLDESKNKIPANI